MSTATTTTLRVGWAITRDHLEPDGSPCARAGYGQTDGQEGSSHHVEVTTGLEASAVVDPVPFRCLDDDGEVYYSGVIARAWLEGDESRAFGPLNFAQADAGAVTMQYREGSAWRTL